MEVEDIVADIDDDGLLGVDVLINKKDVHVIQVHK